MWERIIPRYLPKVLHITAYHTTADKEQESFIWGPLFLGFFYNWSRDVFDDVTRDVRPFQILIPPSQLSVYITKAIGMLLKFKLNSVVCGMTNDELW